MRYAVVLIAVMVLCSFSGICTAQSSEQKEKDAQETAMRWLKLVDEGKYGESWDTAAQLSKSAVPGEQWKMSLKSARKPLGRTLARKLVSSQYSTELPGAPDGEYVVLRYETSFANKNSAVETVTPMKDKDGKWRVSGYYIK